MGKAKAMVRLLPRSAITQLLGSDAQWFRGVKEQSAALHWWSTIHDLLEVVQRREIKYCDQVLVTL
jgi:hypothetical protein